MRSSASIVFILSLAIVFSPFASSSISASDRELTAVSNYSTYSSRDLLDFAKHRGRFATLRYELCRGGGSSSSSRGDEGGGEFVNANKSSIRKKYLWHRFRRFLVIGDSLSIGRSPFSDKVKSTSFAGTSISIDEGGRPSNTIVGVPATSSWRLSFFMHLAKKWGLIRDSSNEQIKKNHSSSATASSSTAETSSLGTARNFFQDNVVGLDRSCRGGSCRYEELFPTWHGALWGSRPEWLINVPKTQQKFKEVFKSKRSPRQSVLWKPSPKYVGQLQQLLTRFPDTVVIFFTNHNEQISLSVAAVAQLIARCVMHHAPGAVFIVVAPSNSAHQLFPLAVAERACALAADMVAELRAERKRATAAATRKKSNSRGDDRFSSSSSVEVEFEFDPEKQCFVTRYPSCMLDEKSVPPESLSFMCDITPFTYDQTHLNPAADVVLGTYFAEQAANCLFEPLISSPLHSFPSSASSPALPKKPKRHHFLCLEEENGDSASSPSHAVERDPLVAKLLAQKVPVCSAPGSALRKRLGLENGENEDDDETMVFLLIVAPTRAAFAACLQRIKSKLFTSPSSSTSASPSAGSQTTTTTKTTTVTFSQLSRLQRRMFAVWCIDGHEARRNWEHAHMTDGLNSLSQSYKIVELCARILSLPSNCFELQLSVATALLYNNMSIHNLPDDFIQALSLHHHQQQPETTTAPTFNGHSFVSFSIGNDLQNHRPVKSVVVSSPPSPSSSSSSSVDTSPAAPARATSWDPEADIIDSARFLQRRKLNDDVSKLLAKSELLSARGLALLRTMQQTSSASFWNQSAYSSSPLAVDLPALQDEIQHILEPPSRLVQLLTLTPEQREAVLRHSQLGSTLRCYRRVVAGGLKIIRNEKEKNGDDAAAEQKLEMTMMKRIESEDIQSVRESLTLRLERLKLLLSALQQEPQQGSHQSRRNVVGDSAQATAPAPQATPAAPTSLPAGSATELALPVILSAIVGLIVVRRRKR